MRKTTGLSLMLFAIMSMMALSSVSAAELVVNGVEMDHVDLKQLGGKKFENCTVEFDANGKPHITIPGIKFQKVTPDKAKEIQKQALAPATSGKYFLAVDLDSSKNTGYQINIYVNEKLVRMFKPGEARFIMDVSTYLRPGKNTLRFVAHKAQPGSQRGKDRLSITFGAGHYDDGVFKMDTPKALFMVTGAQKDDIDRSYKVDIP